MIIAHIRSLYFYKLSYDVAKSILINLSMDWLINSTALLPCVWYQLRCNRDINFYGCCPYGNYLIAYILSSHHTAVIFFIYFACLYVTKSEKN